MINRELPPTHHGLAAVLFFLKKFLFDYPILTDQ